MFYILIAYGSVAFFLILAGHFMGWNNSWEKAFKRNCRYSFLFYSGT